MLEKQDHTVDGGDKSQGANHDHTNSNTHGDNVGAALPTAEHKDAQAKEGLENDPKSKSPGTAATNETDSGYEEGDVAALQDIAFKLKANILKMQEESLKLKQDAIAAQVEALEMKRECLKQWEGLLHRGHVFHANIALLTSMRQEALDAREQAIAAQERALEIMARNI